MASLELPRERIEDVCRRYRVRGLWLVGSAATGEYAPGTSDLDFLVDLGPDPFDGRADCFFGLERELRAITGHPIDLIEIGAISNPCLLDSFNRSRIALYAAA